MGSWCPLYSLPDHISNRFFFLPQKDGAVKWFLPWVVYLLGAGLTFFNNSLLCFFEGCNLIGTIQRIRMVISITTFLFMWLGLVSRLGLHALSVSLFLSSLIGLYISFTRFSRHINKFQNISREFAYSWKEKFWGRQWRYAVSWASGYFIFQMYTPIMFQFHGAVEAGRIGLSIVLWMAVFSISNSWIYAIIPTLNIHISQKRWKELDVLFYRHLSFASITFLMGGITIFAFVYNFRGRLEIVNRLSDDLSLLFLGIAWFLQIIVNSLAVYLRSHKKEPLTIPSLVSAIYIVVSTLFCAKYLPAEYFFLGYLSSYCWGWPWILYIYFKNKKEWQGIGYQIG